MHIRLKYTFRDDTTCNNLIYKLILTVLAEFLYIQRTEMSFGDDDLSDRCNINFNYFYNTIICIFIHITISTQLVFKIFNH